MTAFLRLYGVQLGIGLAIIFAAWFLYHKGEVAAENRDKAQEMARVEMERRINANLSAQLRDAMAGIDQRLQARLGNAAAVSADAHQNLSKEIAHDPKLSAPGAIPGGVRDQLNRIH